MSTRPSARRDPGYAGLTEAVGGLPSPYYFDPDHYRHELSRIWYRHWIYACRAADLSVPRAFRTLEVGDQSILIVRGEDGIARAFHNTCRHRGAALCRERAGRFPAAGIVCPYHAWRYSLKGELLQTSSKARRASLHPPVRLERLRVPARLGRAVPRHGMVERLLARHDARTRRRPRPAPRLHRLKTRTWTRIKNGL
jgi:nitrite reductase/ring-hydroxylating ferredoxin subunit